MFIAQAHFPLFVFHPLGPKKNPLLPFYHNQTFRSQKKYLQIFHLKQKSPRRNPEGLKLERYPLMPAKTLAFHAA